jgi:Predicted transcriptional regulators
MAKKDYTEFRKMRMSAGLTITDLAKEVGVSVSTIHNWESGVSAPTVKRIPRLAETLNTDPGKIVAIITAS